MSRRATANATPGPRTLGLAIGGFFLLKGLAWLALAGLSFAGAL